MVLVENQIVEVYNMKLSVITDSKNIVIGYATVGSLENDIEINIEEIPEDLWKKYYKLEGGKLVVDEDLKAEYVDID